MGIEIITNAATGEVTTREYEDPPIVQVVPQFVSRFQAKAALAQIGKLTAAEAAVMASGSVVLQLAWAEANDFRRDSPGINALAPMIGLDAAGLDALFIAAAQIEA